MPASSERQRRFMGSELGRKRRGEKTSTGMSEEQLRDFARKGHSRGTHVSSPRHSSAGRYDGSSDAVGKRHRGRP